MKEGREEDGIHKKSPGLSFWTNDAHQVQAMLAEHFNHVVPFPMNALRKVGNPVAR